MALQRLSHDFVAAFQQRDYDGAAKFLPDIKLEYAKAGLLAPSGRFSKEDLVAARQLLELGVLVRIHANGDSAEIRRLIAQVRPFYAPQLNLPPSDNESKLVALHLLLILSENRIAEFHTELETISSDAAELDKFLRYPILLERWLMEGCYDKAWQAVTEASQLPAPEFSVLTGQLQSRIRAEIAACAEQSYDSLPIANARHLLYLQSDPALTDFSKERGWNVRGGRVIFAPPAPAAEILEGEEAEEVGTDELMIENMLGYAAQIETII